MADELAKRPESQLAPAPDYITAGNAGFENQQAGDLVFPRAMLMQALSPQVQNSKFSPGDVVNSITEELITKADQPRAVVPIKFWHEWIEWGSRDSGGGILDRSQDPNGELAKRCKAGEKIISMGREVPAITEYMVFLFQPVDTENPCDASKMFCACCARTNYKHARKLLTLARLRGNKPLYAGVYNMTPKREQNTKNQSYYVFTFSNAGWAPKEVFQELEVRFQQMSGVNISSAAPEQGEGEASGGDAAAAAAETEL